MHDYGQKTKQAFARKQAVGEATGEATAYN